MASQSAATSAARKFDEFFQTLEREEQEFMASVVRVALQFAARARAEAERWEKDGDLIIQALSPEYAPNVVHGLGPVDTGQLYVPPPRELGDPAAR
jgi:hypothetical protein